MPIQATNNFVFIIRDKTEDEIGGLIIPDQGKEKPHSGEIFSVGSLVRDVKIKHGKEKTAIFHKGIGFEITYKEVTYLVLMESEIIGIE
jgi:co-chaperonin GroES (HSP10)